MNFFIGRSCLSFIFITALVEVIQANKTDPSSDVRQGRVNGRIVKVYSGPKPDPIICIHEGFKPDPVDCSVFYRCVKTSREKYHVFRYQCGPGTVYDPENEVCNYPHNTKRSECGGIIAFNDTNEENEIEGHELPSPITTKLPIYTNYVLEPSNTTNIPKTTVEPLQSYYDPKTTTTRPISGITTSKLEILIPAYPWMENKNVTKESNKHFPCVTDGFIGDTENCRKFYRCVRNSGGSFTRYEYFCSESTVWDDNIQSCNHAWAARNSRCGQNYYQSYTTKNSFNDSPAEIEQQNSYGQKTTKGIPQEHNLDYDSKVNTEQIENSYIQDNNKKTTSLPKYEINYVNEAPSNYGAYETENEKIAIFSTKNPYSSTSSPINKTIKCTQTGFMGDPSDCSKFYRCVDNGNGGFTKHEFSCSQGTVWDSKVEACNHAWAVQECGGVSPVRDQSPAPIQQGISDNITLISNPSTDSSNTYYMSSSTVSTKLPTISTTSAAEDINNSYFNEINEETQKEPAKPTTVSLISSTTSSTLSFKECEDTGFFGDQFDCQVFYRCVNNEQGGFTKYEYRCGQGTLWDRDLEACNHAWAVKSCNQNSLTNIIETTESTAKVTNSYFQSTTMEYIPNDNYGSEDNIHQFSTTKANVTGLENISKKPETQKNICQVSGFIGDYEDCKKFYRCVDNGNNKFTQHEFICGDETVWDPTIEACNHAWAVKNCGGKKEIKEEMMSSTQANIDDLNNIYTTQNYNTQVTTFSSSAEIPVMSTTMISSSTECNTLGFMGDKNDCRKFYRCVQSDTGGYQKYEFFCADGTLWDPTILACNHEIDVKERCNNVNARPTKNDTEIYEKPTTSNIDDNEIGYETQNNNGSISSTTLRTPATSSSINGNSQCQTSGFIGDDNDCHKFYRCVDNGNGEFVMYEFRCGEGTAWDSKITACNHEWAVEKCGSNQNELLETTSHPVQAVDSQTQETTVTTGSSSVVTSQTQISHTSTSSAIANSESSIKEKQCESEGYFANENNCRKFYRCVSDGKGGYIKYDFNCGDGTMWVQEIQACDHDTEAENCSASVEVITTSTGSYTESSTKSSTSASNASTSTDKPLTTVSLVSTELKPGLEEPNDIKCKDEGYFGDKKDCKKFYRCVSDGKGDYTKYDYICGEGTIWDTDIVACNHPEDVTNPSCNTKQENTSTTSTENTSRPITQPPASTESSTMTSESSSSTTDTNESSTNCTNSNSSENSNSQNFTCSKAGYFPNPYNCKKFYRCVDWEGNGDKFSIFHFECGDGTIWDPALETCNHQDSVYPPRDCSGSQNENVTETASTPQPQLSTTTQYTTQQTTSELQTTELATTAESSTQSSPTTSISTEQSTTQSSTTEQSSTKSTTTEQSTTQSSTTEQSSTNSTTTEQSTTQTSTTDQSSTQSSTTEQTSTEKSSTEQSTTTEQSTIQPSTTESSTTQSSTTDQSTTQSSTTEQSTTKSSTEQSTTTEQSTIQPSTTESTTTQSTTQSSTTEPTTEQSTTQSSTSDQSTQSTSTDQTTTQESTTKSSTEPTNTTEESSTTEFSTETTYLTSMSTDQTTTEQASTSTEAQSSTTESTTTESDKESSTEPTTSKQDCPETNGDQSLFVCPTSFKRHPKYCNLFYQCLEDNDSHEVKIAIFKCPNNTIYDETKVQCVEEGKSNKKCVGQVAQKQRVKRLGVFFNEPIIVTKESMRCSSVGHFPFEINEECSEVMLKCELTKSGKLQSYVYKCPEGFVYWKVSRRCEPIRKVKDCKRSSYPWKTRYDLPLEIFNLGS